jgi:hypothetical protein
VAHGSAVIKRVALDRRNDAEAVAWRLEQLGPIDWKARIGTVATLLLACKAMREEILRIPAPQTKQQGFLPMGLHARPARLRAAIADLSKSLAIWKELARFGLCGNALYRLSSPHPPLQVPRAQLHPSASPLSLDL